MKQLIPIITIVLTTLLCACHSTKSVSQSTVSVCDTTNDSKTQSSALFDANLANSLSLVLDSLDIWIYDYPFAKGQVLPAESVSRPETPSCKDKATPKAIHITAKKAALDKSGTTEIHSRNDSLSTSKSTAHSDKSESANTLSDTTAIAKPPNLTWVLIVGIAAAILIIALIAFLRHR